MSDPTQPPSDPYRPQAPYQPQAPYGQVPPPGPYGQAPYGQAPPGFPYAQVPPAAPRHPNATTAMVLGIVALVGGFMCALPLLMGPVAWVMGGRAVREIDASPTPLAGRGEATAGRITGIVATVLLVLGLLLVVAFVTLFAIAGTSSEFDFS
ncbi:hypothetical protein HMPREF0063_12444 [Aeromicrobium marinum DSM 15272]|uniref:DUF4190 domain-containing protein n=1 Tax=Aeromicrobium marinum DSM 15272 TaxID=585531 RepID=E2SEI5_9ACTN|nr:DUF4190 domain-containing protein [Aeromicrobium marinum]EFQ82282.1 hypothetical protein HMPREF0063_12444 [Aeromicrobium marinum DSM 15272]